MNKLVLELKKWLKNNSSSELANSLGYKNSSTVTNWIHRGSIPRWQIENVKKIIERNRN